jgi:hypothetical protein
LSSGNALSSISGECDSGEDGGRGREVSSHDVTEIDLTTRDKDKWHVMRVETGTYEIPVDIYSCWTEC